MDFLFFFIITFIFLIIFIIYNNKIILPLITCFCAKWIFYCIYKIQFSNIPYRQGDERILHWNSISKSIESFGYNFLHTEIFRSGFYTTIIGSLFKIFSTHSIHFVVSFNIILSIIGLIYFYKLLKIFTNHDTAKLLTIIYSIYPFHIYFSISVLREIIIITLLIISCYYFVKFIEKNKIIYFFVSIFFTLLTSAFHIAITILVFNIILLSSIYLSANYLKIFYKKYIKQFILILIIFLTIGIYALYNFLIFDIYIPKLGNLNDISLNVLFEKMNIYKHTVASQPEFLNINNLQEFTYKSILKFFYFLYAPFFWEVQSLTHLLGFLDGSFIMLLSLISIFYYKKIFNNNILIFLILFILPLIFAHAIFGSNFGTNLRHRTKFIFIFLIISSVGIDNLIIFIKKYLLQKFNFNSKRNNYAKQ